jgi:uncharacterized protein (TIGR03067 family)
MKLARLCTIAAVVGLSASCVRPQVSSDDPNLPREELNRFTGTWQSSWVVVSSKYKGGETISTADPPKILAFAPDGTYKWAHGLRGKGRIVRLDPSAPLAEIDCVLGEGHGRYEGKTQKGIYKLEGDTLIVCDSLPGEPRPTEFKSTKENGWELTRFKRLEKVDR